MRRSNGLADIDTGRSARLPEVWIIMSRNAIMSRVDLSPEDALALAAEITGHAQAIIDARSRFVVGFRDDPDQRQWLVEDTATFAGCRFPVSCSDERMAQFLSRHLNAELSQT